MNNITKQVITELETIKAIASELADMSPRTQMEIVALCKEICLNVDKVLEKHDIDLTTLFNYVNTLESEMEEIRQLIDPQHLAMIDERLEDLEASILTINESIGGINETLSTHTTQIQGLQNNKQDTLTAGDNITIENNVISASGGGDIHLYEHNIKAIYDYFETKRYLIVKVITNDPTPFTYNTLKNYLHNNGFSSNNNVIIASGNVRQSNNYYIVAGIFESNQYVTLLMYASGTTNFSTQYMYSFDNIYDTIVQIL